MVYPRGRGAAACGTRCRVGPILEVRRKRMRFRGLSRRAVRLAAVVAVVSTVAGVVFAGGGAARSHATYVIGVSNTLVGNGWREEMICSVKAQAAASGVVSKVIVA